MGFWQEAIAEGVVWVLGEAVTDALVQKISGRILWVLIALIILIIVSTIIYYNIK